MSDSYDFRKQADLVQPSALFKDMKASVEALLKARVAVRKVHEKLSDVARDASGVYFTDNYRDKDIQEVMDLAYALDRQIGPVFEGIERLEVALKKKVVK